MKKNKTVKKTVKKTNKNGSFTRNGKPVKSAKTNKTVMCEQCANPSYDGLCTCDLSGLAKNGSFTRNGKFVTTTNDDIMDDVCDGLSGLAARESSEWTTPCNVASKLDNSADLPEPRPLKIKTSSAQIDNDGNVKINGNIKINNTATVKTSDPEWFANWKPKKEGWKLEPLSEKPKNTGIPILTDTDRDDVLTEFARIIESRPQSVMDGLERDVANKTKLFLLAKRELLESKQKLELAYSKFISDVKLDKDPLIDEIK